VVRAYLSRQHFEDVENSCPMVALPSDVTRCGKEPKRAFETVFQAMVSVLERSVAKDGAGRGGTGNGRARRTVAQATAALCVGGMVVARAMENRALADELRGACMAVAFELGGWKSWSERERGKRKAS
jgi:hypothetical protein